MGKGKELKAYECERVSAFREDGLSLRNIAERMGKSVKSIHTFLKNPDSWMLFKKKSSQTSEGYHTKYGQKVVESCEKR